MCCPPWFLSTGSHCLCQMRFKISQATIYRQSFKKWGGWNRLHQNKSILRSVYLNAWRAARHWAAWYRETKQQAAEAVICASKHLLLSPGPYGRPPALWFPRRAEACIFRHDMPLNASRHSWVHHVIICLCQLWKVFLSAQPRTHIPVVTRLFSVSKHAVLLDNTHFLNWNTTP